ncbi:MAG: hypothetical protein D4S01_06535 [Dehalococcoidia bacterium]|nr:MAG: hypothetical protein D4S01_06535 [Dehalococcoidia bacterium]
MIELNLMPKDMQVFENKKKKTSFGFKVPNMSPAPVIIGVISVIILSQIILGLIAFVQRKQFIAVTKALSDIAPQQSIASVLKKEVDELSGKFTVIEGLTQGSIVWSKKLYDLNKAMTDGIWLSSLSLNIETPVSARQYGTAGMAQGPGNKQTLILTGFAISSGQTEETATVGRFIDSLKKDKDFFKDFDDIKLSSIQRESYGSTDVMNFTIICYFRPDRSYFEKLQSSAY